MVERRWQRELRHEQSTWKDSPHSDVGYVVIQDGLIVAWCDWFNKSQRWTVKEPFRVVGANGQLYSTCVVYNS